MKKIKILLIMILISIISTGCSVEYNLEVNSSTIKEEIIVNDKITSKRTSKDILNHYNKWYPTYVNYLKNGESIPLPNFNKKADGIEYYNKSIIETNNGYKYTYSYTHDIDQYYDAYVLANTFMDTTVQKTSSTLVLKTSKETFLCKYDYFDSLKVTIKIDPKDYKVNYNNADRVSNNIYTWTIDRNNCKNSQIILTLNENMDDIINNSDIKVENSTENKEKNNDYTMYIFFGVLIILILIGYFIFKKIKAKSEDFDIDD